MVQNIHVNFIKCRLKGYDHVGVGNSTSKRDAMSNAAMDMVEFLIRTKVLEASQVPKFAVSSLLIIYATYSFVIFTSTILIFGSNDLMLLILNI